MWLERCGWGSGLQDPQPPLGRSETERRACREAALRLALEATTDIALSGALRPLFRLGSASPQAQLLRFLELAEQLLRHELPRLRRLVRCEASISPRWQPDPGGGRIDPGASLRRSSGALPQVWLVQRTERFVRTPVNQLLGAILQRTRRLLRQLLQGTPSYGLDLLRRERSLLLATQRHLEAFLLNSPLGSLEEEKGPIAALLRGAAPRREELRNFGSLLRWWQDLSALDLQALLRPELAEDQDGVSVHACYEQVAALGLLLALREHLTPLPVEGSSPQSASSVIQAAPAAGAVDPASRPQVEQASLRFRAPFGEVEARLGAVPADVPWARPVTLLLDARHTDGRQRRIFVDARNCGGIALEQVAVQLALLIHALPGAHPERSHEVLFITPAAPVRPPMLRIGGQPLRMMHLPAAALTPAPGQRLIDLFGRVVAETLPFADPERTAP